MGSGIVAIASNFYGYINLIIRVIIDFSSKKCSIHIFSYIICHLGHNQSLIIFHMVVIAICPAVATEKLKMKLIPLAAGIMDVENVPKWTSTAPGIAPILLMAGNKDLKMGSCVVSVKITFNM